MIYLDNAATTYPKPETVYQKMDWANRGIAVNAGRGVYKVAQEASNLIEDTRKKLIEVVHGIAVEAAVLTPSATISLNMILNGLPLSKGDVVYVSPYEHNAVARTLHRISQEKGIRVEELPLKENLEIDLEKAKYQFVKDRPKCVCCTHVSNVTGYILPIEEIFLMAKKYGAITVMDAAQSFGLMDIDVRTCKADFIVFAGHKTLYGPLGVAGFIDNSTINLAPFIVGGTGSESLKLDMPQKSPSRYEAASKDVVAIAGLHEALSVLNQKWNFKTEKKLTEYAIERLKTLKNVILYTPEKFENHIGVISFNVKSYKSEDIGSILDEDFDIAVRTGYHCAPYVHKYLEDEKYSGTVRIGLGKFNTEDDIDQLVDAISEL
ncbi:aminotransferase class V-fold PLP-dependent enzyme [Blautia sp. NSJ-175]|uniref:aminotransferase class V-fold PLP-dependent enzyme n=1 Tax=Blautia sp. NSJ-175 TaxID=2931396 RepID=UPI001FD199DE|nr:aminotransferase class V-fold PLP-dependent enzyme [Blautia sp. NSJ-175]MCJ7847579.1 aminotransferase class V-fold PLP-dependent enzyme [Blautia sp. NSJ-175]